MAAVRRFSRLGEAVRTHYDQADRIADDVARLATMRSLEDLFASEARSQSLTSAFRRERGIPSLAEILRFGVARPIAELMRSEMLILKARGS